MKIFSKPFVWILLLALVVRVAAAVYLGNTVSGLSGAQDEITYSTLGIRAATGHGFTFPTDWYPWIHANAPQSYFSMAMSIYLAIIYRIFGYVPLIARLIQALLGTAVVGLVTLLAQKIFGKTVAILTGCIASLYAYLVFYSVTLTTETPFIFFLLASLYLAYEIHRETKTWKWVLLGLTLTGAVLFRMAVIFFVPFLLGWVIYTQRSKWRMALIPIALILLGILPFTIRNYIEWHQFLLLESQFGHVFWNGNHPDQHGDFRPLAVFPIPPSVLTSQNDAIITNTLMKMGIENVLKDPLDFASLTLTRLREFFKFWPSSDSNLTANVMRVVSFGVLWPFMVLGLIVTRKMWRDLLPLYLFCLLHTGVYAISWTLIRYRIPLDIVLIPFAAFALYELALKVKPIRKMAVQKGVLGD